MGIMGRAVAGWNAFWQRDQNASVDEYATGGGYIHTGSRRTFTTFYNDKSILASIYNRISMDVARVQLRHAMIDDQGRFAKNIESSLSDCLTYEPNMDQGPAQFMQEIVQVLFDQGVAAIVPVDTATNPNQTDRFDVYTMRVGTITAWYPKHVRVSLYNEETGIREDLVLEKRIVSIIENPLYAVMNEPNSTLQRLIRKLGLLDAVDEQSGSGKLDLIIQLPYTIKSEARRQQAEQRREDIEMQLKSSQYGIAYTDGTEKVTQLNRSADNNLMAQVEYLVKMLYGQLGITEEIMLGTADETAMLNYTNRTIEPILVAIIQAMQRSLVGPSGTKAGERILFFRDPFKMVPLEKLAEIADKFTRNEIMTANEIRTLMGMPPSSDPKADKLVNSNMPAEKREPEDNSLEKDNDYES